MSIKDVNCPVNTANTGSKLGDNIPGSSPGAKSVPGREDARAAHSVSPQSQLRAPQPRTASHQEQPIPGSTPVTIGPED